MLFQQLQLEEIPPHHHHQKFPQKFYTHPRRRHQPNQPLRHPHLQ
jgi:hypothetical protein